jgi:hypothetical protein
MLSGRNQGIAKTAAGFIIGEWRDRRGSEEDRGDQSSHVEE